MSIPVEDITLMVEQLDNKLDFFLRLLPEVGKRFGNEVIKFSKMEEMIEQN
jgi:hypothetical protein